MDTSSDDNDGDANDFESSKTRIRKGSYFRKSLDSHSTGTRRTPDSGHLGAKTISRSSGAGNPNTSSTKRRRSSSSLSSTRLGSKENPINVDKVASLFEPMVIREYVWAFRPSIFLC